jgi:hypothetical protein
VDGRSRPRSFTPPSAAQALLDDSVVNIDEWLTEEIQVAFAQQEGTAFVSGTGTSQPKGFLNYTKVANASWEWDKIGYIATGKDVAFADDDPSDSLVDLYSPKSDYRQCPLGDEPRDAGRDQQDEGRRLQLYLAAAGTRRPRAHAVNYPNRGVRGHAERGRGQLLDCVLAISRVAISWSTASASACCASPNSLAGPAAATRPPTRAAATFFCAVRAGE